MHTAASIKGESDVAGRRSQCKQNSPEWDQGVKSVQVSSRHFESVRRVRMSVFNTVRIQEGH